MKREFTKIILSAIGLFSLFIARGNAAEGMWQENGEVICNAAGVQDSQHLISDGTGGAIIVWQDTRSGNYDIYCQRINNIGESQWVANGVAICNAAGDQRYPQLVSDEAGGAIITWQDNRNGPHDIYCQRINRSGQAQWINNGIVVCDTGGDRQYPKLVSDGAGGAIIVWMEWHDIHDNRIFSQHVNRSGETQWGNNGILIGNADGAGIIETKSAQLIGDGSGGAIIAWSGWNGSEYDIYSQRINT